MDLLRRTLTAALVAACFAPITSAHTSEPAISYIGLNHFKADDNLGSETAFTTYIDVISPIMERHGLTLAVARVTHRNADAIAADAVTFGTAPDQESFEAFFADPEFQAAFPTLVEIIETHTVVFLSAALSPPFHDETSLLLTLDWLADTPEASAAAVRATQDGLAELKERYGVSLKGDTLGVGGNRGLTDDVEPIDPPDAVQLQSFQDAHGYLEHPEVMAAREAAGAYIERGADYWLEPWRADAD